jgi:hypothetical protein
MIATISVSTAIAQGKVRSTTISFIEDTMVNDAMVKKGEYRVQFNDETGEMSIMKDGDLVVKAKGRVIDLDNKARYTAISTSSNDKGRFLTGLQFEGSRKSLVFEDSPTSAPAGEQRR